MFFWIAQYLAAHFADWALVGVTVLAAAASTVVAVFAYRNGRTAVIIADESSKRDYAQRQMALNLQTSEIERQRRERRGLFGMALKRRLASYYMEAFGMKSSLRESDYVENSELDRLAIETGEPSAADFQFYLTTRMDLRKSDSPNLPSIMDLDFELGRLINEWVDDPKSITLTYRDAYVQEGHSRE